MKKSSWALLLIIIIILIIVGVYFLVGKTSSTTVPASSLPVASSSTSAISADWQTYDIAPVNLAIKVPADFVRQAVPSGIEFVIPTVPASATSTATSTYFTHLTHEAYIEVYTPTADCVNNGDGGPTSTSTIVVDGVQFTRSMWSGVGAGNLYQGIDYTTIRNGACLEITLYTHSTDGEGFYTGDQAQIQQIDSEQAVDMQNIYKLADQIVSAVTFSK